MRTQEESVEAAIKLAAEKNVKTSAKTVKGILKAIKSAGVKRNMDKSKGLPAKHRVSVSIDDLVKGFNQSKFRSRTMDIYHPLFVVISAVMGEDWISMIHSVPNSYRGNATQSCASAVRCGDAILVEYGRYSMEHSSYGSSSKKLIPNGRCFIRRRDVLNALPNLPMGYQWITDSRGALIAGSEIISYRPSGEEIADAIKSKTWDEVIQQFKTKKVE